MANQNLAKIDPIENSHLSPHHGNAPPAPIPCCTAPPIARVGAGPLLSSPAPRLPPRPSAHWYGSEERAAVVISTVRFSARCFEILYPPVKSCDEEHLEGGIKHKLLKIYIA